MAPYWAHNPKTLRFESFDPHPILRLLDCFKKDAMFNLKQELKTIKSELLTRGELSYELSEIAWRCRRDLSPGTNSKDLFELAYEKRLIKQAFASDQYGVYYVVVT